MVGTGVLAVSVRHRRHSHTNIAEVYIMWSIFIGIPVTFNIFLILRGYSRKKYIELTLDRAQDTLMSAMIRAFIYFGGVPKEILFDNMRTVVDQSKTEYSKPVINERFYQFSKDVGFEVWACRPYRPQTKGKVEALAKTMERLRPYDYEFDDVDELDEIIRDLLEDLNNEVSNATNQIPKPIRVPWIQSQDRLESQIPSPYLFTRSISSTCLSNAFFKV